MQKLELYFTGQSPTMFRWGRFTNPGSRTSWLITCPGIGQTPQGGASARRSFKSCFSSGACNSHSNKSSPPSGVLLDRSPDGSCLKHPSSTLDGAVSLPPFPYIPLLERTLIKIREDQVKEVVLITPSWLRRSLFHLLLQMAYKIHAPTPLQKGRKFHSHSSDYSPGLSLATIPNFGSEHCQCYMAKK